MGATKPIRKACDLCYRRKLKCDGKQPRCSQCITYEIDCTYMAPSRTHAPKKRRSQARAGDDAGKQVSGSPFQQVTQSVNISESSIDIELLYSHGMASAITSEDNNISLKSMVLPPLEQVLPVIQIYLQTFNSVLPLFDADTLLGLVHDTYSLEPTQRDPVSWAAINVVLALARRYNPEAGNDIPPSTTFLSRAESVLSKVILGDTQLLNIQVLVGMVTLLQAAQDLKPALVLIATTMRLAHMIGLHDRAYSAHLDASPARQRACVFWLAYILDKDLSMRSEQPAIQLDDDINIDLPSSTVPPENDTWGITTNADEGMGVMMTADGTATMSYFRARIQLAAVEGGVYDYIYSTRSQKRSLAERSHALQSVTRALEQWKASIPPEFRALKSTRRVNPTMLRFLGALHSTSLACTTLINQAHAWDSEWIDSIRRYGRQGIVPLLPQRWEALVGEARDLMVLFSAIGETDAWDFWTTGCSYMTAMVLLTANNMHRPKHDDSSLDAHLVEIGLQTIGHMARETENEKLLSFQATCTELHSHATKRCLEHL